MPKLSGLKLGYDCKICDVDVRDTGDTEYVAGYFGIIPVTFCKDCYRLMLEMAAHEFGLYEGVKEDGGVQYVDATKLN